VHRGLVTGLDASCIGYARQEPMIRSITAVILGVFLFYMLQQTAMFIAAILMHAYMFGPRRPADDGLNFYFISYLFVALTAALCGYCTAWMAQREEFLPTLILAVVLAVFSPRWSLIFHFDTGPSIKEQGGYWTVLGLHASLMMAGAMTAGYLRERARC
jgi:hypothetical protein